MNEEAIKTMYSIAQGEGYGKSIDDFKTLLSANEEAFNTMYSLAQENGYQKTAEDFSELMGVKKKRNRSFRFRLFSRTITITIRRTA